MHRTRWVAGGVQVCIHRGSCEIGGNCVELESDGRRLVIDVGRPLESSTDDHPMLPNIGGIADGVVLSHPHQDHYGLVHELDASVPIYMGQSASAILHGASFFAPSGIQLKPAGLLGNRKPFRVGPFVVTPYLVDHSAFDSYALLVEANGRRLLYSGDFRAHGRKARLAEHFLSHPPRNVHVLLLEGTHIRSFGNVPAGRDESDIEFAMANVFRETGGLVGIFTATQNIDRLVTIYRACKRVGRTLVVDLYAATIASATRRVTIPQPGFPALRVYVPNRQRILVKQAAAFERVESIRACRIYLDEIRDDPEQFVMVMQGSTLPEVARAGCLDHAAAIWSLWAGYLNQSSGARVVRLLEEHGVPIQHLHASGHARIADLQALASAVAPTHVVPIHSSAPERFSEFLDNVQRHEDGEWWTA